VEHHLDKDAARFIFLLSVGWFDARQGFKVPIGDCAPVYAGRIQMRCSLSCKIIENIELT